MDDNTPREPVKVDCRYRPDGLELLVKQLLMKDGFVGLVLPRISLDGDEISITVSMNIGVGSREREYFAFEFDIPVKVLSEKYQKLVDDEIEIQRKEIEGLSVPKWSPFSQRGPIEITDKDAEKLRGEPAPLKILIPVEIEKDEKSPDAGAVGTDSDVPT